MIGSVKGLGGFPRNLPAPWFGHVRSRCRSRASRRAPRRARAASARSACCPRAIVGALECSRACSKSAMFIKRGAHAHSESCPERDFCTSDWIASSSSTSASDGGALATTSAAGLHCCASVLRPGEPRICGCLTRPGRHRSKMPWPTLLHGDEDKRSSSQHPTSIWVPSSSRKRASGTGHPPQNLKFARAWRRST